MPVNKRTKFRGSRTCGGGTHKNRRGAGNRGGRGRAGHRDHRFTHYLLAGEINNGKHGFHQPAPADIRIVDIGLLDEIVPILLKSGLARMEGDAIVIDASELGYDKILGSGRVTRKIMISAEAFSEQARKKIEASGGQALII